MLDAPRDERGFIQMMNRDVHGCHAARECHQCLRRAERHECAPSMLVHVALIGETSDHDHRADLTSGNDVQRVASSHAKVRCHLCTEAHVRAVDARGVRHDSLRLRCDAM